MERYIICLILIYLAVINAAGFAAMFLDKRRAVKGHWRISERTLLLLAVLGGSIGSLAGMYLFRHKTKHFRFKFGIPVILIIQMALIVMILVFARPAGADPAAVTARYLDQIEETQNSQALLLEPLLDYAGAGPSPEEEALLGETASLFYRDFSYQITSSTVNSDTASVAAVLTMIDTRSLAQDLCLALTAERIAVSDNTDPVPSHEKMLQLLHDTLTAHLYSLQTLDAEFLLQNESGTWVLIHDENCSSMLSGHLSSYIYDPDLLAPSQILRLYLDYFQSMTASEWSEALNTTDLFAIGSREGSEKLNLCYYEQLAEHLNCTIAGEEVFLSDTCAEIPVLIASVDMPSVMQDYRSSLIAYAGSVDSIVADSDTLEDTTAALLTECLEKNTATFTAETVITMYHDGLYWYPEITEEITNLFMGNMEAALSVMQNG